MLIGCGVFDPWVSKRRGVSLTGRVALAVQTVIMFSCGQKSIEKQFCYKLVFVSALCLKKKFTLFSCLQSLSQL